MQEEGLSFEEVYYEMCLFKKRSEQYRTSNITLQSKMAELEKRLAAERAFRVKQEALHKEAIQDMEFQLKNAIEVITTLRSMLDETKGLLKKSQEDRLSIMEQHNERLIEIDILKEKLFRTGSYYDQCLALWKKQIEDADRLREVNAKLIAEMRKRDAD